MGSSQSLCSPQTGWFPFGCSLKATKLHNRRPCGRLAQENTPWGSYMGDEAGSAQDALRMGGVRSQASLRGTLDEQNNHILSIWVPLAG